MLYLHCLKSRTFGISDKIHVGIAEEMNSTIRFIIDHLSKINIDNFYNCLDGTFISVFEKNAKFQYIGERNFFLS